MQRNSAIIKYKRTTREWLVWPNKLADGYNLNDTERPTTTMTQGLEEIICDKIRGKRGEAKEQKQKHNAE